MTKVFKGSKGGGGSFKQTPDNLRSNDTFEGVLGVGIGPMKGPQKGLKSVKIDGTAVENATGQLNFGDFVVNIGDGDPVKWPQTVNLKLGAGAAPTQVGLSITNPKTGGAYPTGPGPWVTKTLNNLGADFIDMRFIVNSLFRQDKKGIYEATATLEIQMKPVGKTNWIAPETNTPSGNYNQSGVLVSAVRVLVPQSYYNANGTPKPSTTGYRITGKTTSPAVYELRINVPNEGVYANTAWDVRVRLVERESYLGGTDNADQEARTVTWESMSAVYPGVMGNHEDWRGVAWMQVYGKASDQLTGVPEVTGVWDTKIVSVPPSSIFNPDTRQYVAGTWDGSFSKAFTTDPAWIINDAISDSLSGLSLVAAGSYLNKWDALEASKWFSQLVPDGNGGTEPRYSLNLSVSAPQKAEEFVRFLAGAVGALAWDQGDGEWRLKCDKPDVASDIFTLDNIEGEFTYSHTDVDTRSNDITMSFKNKDMDYRQDSVRLFDNASIALIGRKPTNVVAVGCTGRQEAMRRCKLRLCTTVGEVKLVNFTTNRRGRNIDHLDLILVADGDLGEQQKRTTGRTVAVSADRKTITLRDPVYLAQGVAYNIRFASPNASYRPTTALQPPELWKKPTLASTRQVTNPNGSRGSVTVLTLDVALPADIADNLTIGLEATNLPTVPKLYRVTSVVNNDDGERVSISALEVNTAKWDLADNVSKSDTVFQDLRGAVPAPLAPQNGSILSLARVPIEQGFQTNLVANWLRPPGAFINGFQVVYSINGGARKVAIENTQANTYEFVNPVAGRYDVEIRTMDRRGGLSTPLTSSITITQDQLTATDVRYVDGTTVEYMKPQDPGATKGLGGELIAGMSGQQIVDSIGFNTDTMFNDLALTAALRQMFDFRTLINGKGVGTYVGEFKDEQSNTNLAVAQTLKLMGSSIEGGTAFQFDLNTTRVRKVDDKGVPLPDGSVESLSSRLTSIGATAFDQRASIDTLNEVLIDPSGATVRSVMKLDANGYISGMVQTNNGKVSTAAYRADIFQIVSSDGNGTLFTPFTVVGNVVRMTNVEVDTIKAGSVTIDGLAVGLSQVLSYSGTDITVTTSEKTLIETPSITLGDDKGGRGLATVAFTHDASLVQDAGTRFRLYVDSGGGYELRRQSEVGARTTSGNTFGSFPVSFNVTLSATVPVKLKLTVQSYAIPGASGGAGTGHYARSANIDILRLAR